MRFSIRFGAAVLFAALSMPALHAQSAAELQHRLDKQFKTTKVTADRSDIVTAGNVLVLHKDGLVMYSTPTETSPLNNYRDGRIQVSTAGNIAKQWGHAFLKGRDTSEVQNIPQRKFVAGEKFWVTGIAVQQDGVVFTVYSDPISDVRYWAQLKFPFPKNNVPPADAMLNTIGEVITVQPDDDAKADDQAPADKAAPAAAAAPAGNLETIAPPPPPADAPPPPPKTIAVGQTKDMVIANWGQPTKIVKLAAKEIYYYPDMKVTFVAGKVKDVE